MVFLPQRKPQPLKTEKAAARKAKREKLSHNAINVFNKQKWHCATCGKIRALQAHHKKYRSAGGGYNEGNLIGLCGECHNKTHRG